MSHSMDDPVEHRPIADGWDASSAFERDAHEALQLLERAAKTLQLLISQNRERGRRTLSADAEAAARFRALAQSLSDALHGPGPA